MKNLAVALFVVCAGCVFGQDNSESSSHKEKSFQRYENGELVEDKYYLEKDGQRVAGEDFAMPDMDAKMQGRMNAMQSKMSTMMDSRMSEMNNRMEEMQLRTQKMQADMMKRMQESQQKMNQGQKSLDQIPSSTSQPISKPVVKFT